MTREHQHAEFVHELGHVVQYALMPDPDQERWSRYRLLRGIEDAETFSSTSPHADRPHEIFAEDFRALFGGATANYSGSIENASLESPQRVAGLESFMRELVGPALVSTLQSYPNPSRRAVDRRGGTWRAPVNALWRVFWEQAVTEAERAELRSVALGFVQHVCGREEALWARFHANLARAEAAMAEAIEEPFVKGSTGQLVEHPGFKVAARCDDLALRLYAKLTEGQDGLLGDLAAACR